MEGNQRLGRETDMGVTREDLKQYISMKQYLVSVLDPMIEDAYNTYHSPQLSAQNGSSGTREPGDPVARAYHRLEKLRNQREILINQMIEIEEFVESIEDWYEKSILQLHYLEGYTWEATCLNLRKHHSLSVVTSYDAQWWKNYEENEKQKKEKTGKNDQK